MKLRASEIFDAARLRVSRKFPYFDAATWRLRPYPMDGFGTMAIDVGGRVIYDPATVEEWGPKATAAVFLHEISHWIREHFARLRGFPPKVANLGADLEINQSEMFTGEFALPNPILPKHFNLPRGLLAEEYAVELQNQDQGQDQNDSHGPKNRPMPGRGQCGGCAGNPWPEEELPEDAPPALTPVEQMIIRETVAAAIVAAAKGRGDVPGDWTKWSQTILIPPRIPWNVVLRAALRASVTHKAGQVDYSRAKLARTYAARKAVLGARTPLYPGLVAPIPRVALVIDTSESMGQGEGSPLQQALSEIMGVVRATGAPVRAYGCDAQVGAVSNVLREADVQRLAGGGGGTDLRVGIQAALKFRPDILLVLTDGQTPWPSEPPPVKTIVVLFGPDAEQPPETLKTKVIYAKNPS